MYGRLVIFELGSTILALAEETMPSTELSAVSLELHVLAGELSGE